MADGAHRRRFLELAQCTLDGSLARAERTRERRGRPRLAALEQGEDGTGGTVDRRRQHDDGTAPDGDEREAAPGRLDPGGRAQGGAQAADAYGQMISGKARFRVVLTVAS